MATTRGATAGRASRPRGGVAVVVAVVFLDLLGFGIVVPILPFYVRSLGVSDVFVGLAAAAYSFAGFLAAPTLGRLADERGRRPVLVGSVGVAGLAWLAFGLAGEVDAAAGPTAALAVLLGSRALAGAAGGNVAAAQAYLADVTPPERRADALGLLGAAFSLGFVFGPALGGLLAGDAALAAARALLPAAVPVTTFSLPSFAAAALSFAACATGALVLREPEREPEREADRAGALAALRLALADDRLRPLVVAFLLASFAFAGVQVMFVPFVADAFGYGAPEAALLLTYVGVLGTLNQGVLVGRAVRRLGARRVSRAGALVLVAALVLLPVTAALPAAAVGGPPWLTGGLVGLLAFGALAAVGNGALTVGLTTLVSTAGPERARGRAFGVTQGAASLGRAVGPPLAAAGYVVAVPLPFLAGALVLVPVVVLLGARR